jgi:hypothetical protein
MALHCPASSGSRPGGDGVQKLLQMERSLHYLCAKEGKAVLDCVARAMFIGPTFKHGLARVWLENCWQSPCAFLV